MTWKLLVNGFVMGIQMSVFEFKMFKNEAGERVLDGKCYSLPLFN